MNTTTITGNLTREPEIRYTREGQATAQLGVAVNRRWQDRTTQEWQESTSFFDVTCWRDLAENVALSLTKGMRVVVTGRLEQRTWETEDGEHRSKVEITADEVGPSLRFATADVQRVERRSAGMTNGDAGADADTDAVPAVRATTLVGAHPARALAVTAAVASLALACGVPLLARLRRR
jgi:single-strand DNA-binding protein